MGQKRITKPQARKVKRVSDEDIDSTKDSQSVSTERDAIQAELRALLDDIDKALDDC